MRSLPIDWEELELALTWRMDEGRYFLDREELDGELRRSRPFRRFKDVLAGHPAERERWFAFHSERVREATREWLAENAIEGSPPPER
jgi:hypothetical protein